MIIKRLWVKTSVVFLAIVVPILLFLLWTYGYLSMTLQEKHIEINGQILSNVSESVGMSLLEIQGFYEKVFFYDYDVIRFPLNEKSSIEHDIAKQRLLNKFQMYALNVHNVEATFMYFPLSDDLIVSAKTFGELKGQWYLEKLRNSTDEVSWGRYDWVTIVMDGKTYLFKRFLVEFSMEAAVLVDAEQLTRSFTGGEYTYVFDGDGVLLASGGPAEFAANVKAALPENTNRLLINDKNYYFIKQKTQNSNIWLAMLIPPNALYNARFFNTIFFILGISGLLAIIIFMVFLHKWLSVPMRTLTTAMSEIGRNGDMELTIGPTGSYEFDFLIERFLEMISQIKKLQIDAREQKLILSNAEIKILQNQINPHFFMNSINIIASLAELKNYELIKRMAVHLADYFRFTQGVNREAVTCREEVNHLVSYLEIQKMRYNNQFDYKIDICERHQGLLLPPLSLQPFVENAVKHGFVKKEEIFCVSVSSFDDGDNVCFVISDNGIGLTPEQIDTLSNCSEDSDKYNHIGISNVRQRLKKYFGWINICFESVLGEKTTVYLTTPTVRK